MVTACQPGKTTLAIRWTQRTKMSCTASAMIGMVVILPKNSPPNSPSSRCCLHFSRIHSSSSCDQSICKWSVCLYLYMYNHTIMYRKEMKIQKCMQKFLVKCAICTFFMNVIYPRKWTLLHVYLLHSQSVSINFHSTWMYSYVNQTIICVFIEFSKYTYHFVDIIMTIDDVTHAFIHNYWLTISPFVSNFYIV